MTIQVSNHPLILLFTRPRSEIEPKLTNLLQDRSKATCSEESHDARMLKHCFIDNPLDTTLFHGVRFDLNADSILTGLKIGYEYANLEGHKRDLMDMTGFAEGLSFGSLLGSVAVLWEPAHVVVGFAHFQSAVIRFSVGDAFPVTCTVYFAACVENELITEGLSWFCGQEIEFDHTGLSQQEALNRLLQITNQLIVNGPVTKPELIQDKVAGKFISITPSEHGTILYLTIV